MEEENTDAIDIDIEQMQQERDEYLEGWKRAKADLANYKKEEGERMQQMGEYITKDLLLKVFPILDNVERATQQIPVEEQDSQIYKGLVQIVSQWQGFLKNQGIEEMQVTGEAFNPEFHEAVEEVEGEESGMVAEELERGYKMGDRVLRPAKVKVTK